MKQGVQLVLERVQRHRAFPRLATANGQNLQPTLSPANTPAPLATRLEPPRFIPVVAEPSTQNVAGSEMTVPKLQPREEINAVADNILLEVEAAFQTFATDAIQFDEQVTEQIFEQTLAPETSQRFENAEIVEAKISSENLVSETPNQNPSTQPASSPRVGQQSEIANERSSNLATVRQVADVQPRAVQNNQAAKQQPISEATQTRRDSRHHLC